jgi:arylsulfatase B
VSLTAHDWLASDATPWNQRLIRQAEAYATKNAKKSGINKKPVIGKSHHRGHWGIKVLASGRYTVSLRRWPVEAEHPITAGLPPGADVPGAQKAFRAHEGRAVPLATAALRIDGKTIATQPIVANATHVDFDCDLTEGSHALSPVFVDASGNEVGAYYAVITKR